MNDGTIPLPLIGSVRVSGITLQQATFWIKELMGQQLLKPDLQLRVVKPRPIQVALVGEVERPGLYWSAVMSSGLSVISGGVRIESP